MMQNNRHHQHQQRSSIRKQISQNQFLDGNVTASLDELVDRLNNPDYHILALLIGTSDGAGLYRTNGSMNSNSPTSHLSEEIISGIESVWASLPSGTGHHLRPLGLGNDVKTVTAFYENCTLLHAYMSPLVVTILATTDANIGAIRAIFPNLFELLESTRQTLIDATERIRSRMK